MPNLPRELLVKIGGDASALQRAGATSTAVLNRIGDTAKSIAVSVGAIGATAVGIGYGVKKAFLDPFAEAQEAAASLSAALAATGKDGAAGLKAVAEEAARLQRITTAEDDALVKATAKLATLAPSLKTDELVRAQRALVAIAEVTGGDLDSAAAALGKTLGGTTNALKRTGIEVDMTRSAAGRLEEILGSSKLGAAFSVAEAKAETFGGRMIQLQNAVGDLRETFGEIILRALDLTGGAGTLADRLADLNDAIQANMAKWVAWAQVGVAAVKGVGTTLFAIVDVAFQVGEMIGRAFDIAASLMIGAFLKASDAVRLDWGELVNDLQGLFDPLDIIPDHVFESTAGKADAFFENAKQQVAAFKHDLDQLKGAITGIGDAWKGIQSAAETARGASGGLAPQLPPGAAPAVSGPSGALPPGALAAGNNLFAPNTYRPFAFPGVGLAGAAGGGRSPFAIKGDFGNIPEIFQKAAGALKPLGDAAQQTAQGWKVSSETLISSIGNAAQAVAQGGQNIEQTLISMVQNIIANISSKGGGLFGATPWGMAIGAGLGILGSLFGRHSSQPVPVRLSNVDDAAARSMANVQNERPIQIRQVIVTPEGRTIEEIEYELRNRALRNGAGAMLKTAWR